jgi:hypothetical protein
MSSSILQPGAVTTPAQAAPAPTGDDDASASALQAPETPVAGVNRRQHPAGLPPTFEQSLAMLTRRFT